MDAPNKEFALAGSLEELKAKGRLVVHGGHRPILVIYDRCSAARPTQSGVIRTWSLPRPAGAIGLGCAKTRSDLVVMPWEDGF